MVCLEQNKGMKQTRKRCFIFCLKPELLLEVFEFRHCRDAAVGNQACAVHCVQEKKYFKTLYPLKLFSFKPIQIDLIPF
jgi:hypothetical protein